MEDIGNQFVNYFKNSFNSTNPPLNGDLESLFRPCRTKDENKMLCSISNENDI
jgi:hypothetical protein